MVAFKVAAFSFCSTEEWKWDQLKPHAHAWVLLRHLLAAVKGGFFHGHIGENSPPRSVSQISSYCGQPSLEVLVFTTLKVTWSSETPRNASPGDILASVPVFTTTHPILHWQCHDWLFLEPSWLLWVSWDSVATAGFSTSSCSIHLELWWDSLLLLIRLLNKISEILNLAVCY